MPELPEMQALAERLDALCQGTRFVTFAPLSFSGLKTVRPAPADLLGATIERVGRRGKYVVFETAIGRVVIHLSQAGRLDVESPPKASKGRGAIVRIGFDNGTAVLLREYGHERKAGWWVLAPEDDGPLASLGPEVDSDAFAEQIRHGSDARHLHTLLRDQHFGAGLGRGHTDDVLHAAQLSPYASLDSLGADERERLLGAIHATLTAALVGERARSGGLSEPSLGDHFHIHNHAGTPCPRCSTTLARVSFESYEIVYCPQCQTKGKVLADRRLSRLLR